jgi:hypothetical protein
VDESVTNIIKQDHNRINQHLEYLVHEYPRPFLPINFKPVTKKEISEIIISFNGKTCKICNRMLSTGTFTTRLKFSQVYPIFKKR